jgi:hypothetical protein
VLQLHLDRIMCGYWEISPSISGYAPSTPHYNRLLHHSIVPLPMASDPTIECYVKVQCYLRGRTLHLLEHEHLFSLLSHADKLHLSTLCFFINYFMYDSLVITSDCEIYCEGSKIIAKALVHLFLSSPFSHMQLTSQTS